LTKINEAAAHLPHDDGAGLGYEGAMSRQSIAMELVRALCVLVVVFLNFAHQAPVLAKPLPTDLLAAASSLSFCGDGEAVPDERGHAPCHACRLGAAADLPPIPAPLPMPVAVEAVAWGALPVLQLPEHPPGPQSARGPPALV
jgi:hypothetical protein